MSATQPRTQSERIWRSVRRVLLGAPLSTEVQEEQRLSKVKALAVFSSDALSSSAYATDEILIVLAAAVGPWRPAWLASDVVSTAQPAAKVDFATQIEPILREQCYECHGEKKGRGKLRLHLRDLALKGGATGPLLVPGDSAKSYVVQRLLGEGGEDQMPLDKDPLSAEQTALIRAWIDQGAEWPSTPGAGTLTTTQRNNALNRYNSAAAKGIIPDANMRAAVVSLTGTLAEPAIAAFIDGTNLTGKPYTIVAFDVPPDSTVPVAQTILNTSTNRLRTVIKPEFSGEPFQVVSAFLAHEALHQDATVGLQEEEMANVAEVLTYAQQVLADPTFVSSKTALTNLENDRLYALLQSGQATNIASSRLKRAQRRPGLTSAVARPSR